MTEEQLYPYQKPAPGSLDFSKDISLLYLQAELDEEFGVGELSRVFVDWITNECHIYSFSRGNLDRALKLVESFAPEQTTHRVTKSIIPSKTDYRKYAKDVDKMAKRAIAATRVVDTSRPEFSNWMELSRGAVGVTYGMIPLFSPVPPPFLASPHIMEVMGIVVKLGLHETYDTWRYVYNPPPAAEVVFPIRSDASFKLSTKWKDASIVDQAECIYWMDKRIGNGQYCEIEEDDESDELTINVYLDKLTPELEEALETFLPFDESVCKEQLKSDIPAVSYWLYALEKELRTHDVTVNLEPDMFGHTEGPEQVVVSTWSIAPNWDICKPTVYVYDTANAPDGSVFHKEEVKRMISLLVRFHGHPGTSCVIREGPGPSYRLSKWKSDEEVRRRLVNHLVSIPHVLVDMPNEPMVPWKGMKFFHGTDFEDLQTKVAPEVPREGEFMIGDEVRSQTGFGGFIREVRSDPRELVLSDSLTDKVRFTVRVIETMKVVTPAWQVGHRVEGQGTVVGVDYTTFTLDMLAPNGFDHTIPMAHAKRDPPIKESIPECNLSWETIEGGTTNQRTGAKEDLHLSAFSTPYFTKALNYGPKIYTYRLLKDGKALKMLDLRNDYAFYSHKTEIDAFRIVSELSGIPHIARKYRTDQARQLWELFQGMGIDGAILNTDVEWIWFQPKEVLKWEQPGPPSTMTWQLLNGSLVAGGDGKRDKKLLVDLLVKEDGWRITPEMVEKLLEVLPNKVMPLSEISHLRWSLDNNPSPYVNQYSAFSRFVAPIWRPVELLRTNMSKARIYDISYAALWAAFSEKEDDQRYRDLYMAAAVTEGSCNHLLPYNRLLSSIQTLNDRLLEGTGLGKDWYPIHLRVRLPTGVIQIVPPFDLEQEEYMSLPRELNRLPQPQEEEESKMDTSEEVKKGLASKRKQETELERPIKDPRLQARMRWFK